MADEYLFISAGDPSGDNASALVIEKLLDKKKSLQLFGLGGEKLKKLGQQQLADPKDLAVIGFWEVAPKFFFFRRLFKQCIKEIKSKQPKAVLLVDYPGFNLRLAKAIKDLGIPVIYYITPQVWAWGKGRIDQIRKYVDLVIPILPFEENFFKENEINSKYVGHYLLEDIPKEYIASQPKENGHLALLPGSRKQEIERMLEPMIKAAQLYYKRNGVKAKIAAISERFDYESYIAGYEDFVSIEYDNAREVIYESSVVLTASGTATLEVGIIGRPMIIIYKTGWLTYQVAKNLITLDKIGLVNLVLDELVVPELIQHEANAEHMAAKLLRIQSDEKLRVHIVDKLHTLKNLLGDGQASEKVAEIIFDTMEE